MWSHLVDDVKSGRVLYSDALKDSRRSIEEIVPFKLLWKARKDPINSFHQFWRNDNHRRTKKVFQTHHRFTISMQENVYFYMGRRPGVQKNKVFFCQALTHLTAISVSWFCSGSIWAQVMIRLKPILGALANDPRETCDLWDIDQSDGGKKLIQHLSFIFKVQGNSVSWSCVFNCLSAEVLTANMNFSFTLVGQLLYAFHDRCLFRVWELEPPREGAWKSVSPLEEGEIHPHWACCKCDSAEAGSCDEWCLFYA